MKYNGRLVWIVALLLFVGAISSSAHADTLAVTIQKWTTNWGSLTATSSFTQTTPAHGSSGAGTFAPFGFQYQGPSGTVITTDPFAGAVDIQMNFGLISDSTTQDQLFPDMNITKVTSGFYWIKIFVEDTSFTLPGSSGTTLSATTTYQQTANTNTSGTFKATISDSSSSVNFASASLPVTPNPTSDTKSFTRASSTYDVKQEWDVALLGAALATAAHMDGSIKTVMVPEPVTLLSALIGLAPLGLMVRSFRRRKSAGY